MDLVEDNRTGGFTFTWSIHKFGYVQKVSDYLDSPEFETTLFTGGFTKKWHLRLYPKGDSASGFISYYLRQNALTLYNYTFNFVLSIRISNGSFQELGTKTFNIKSNTSEGYKFFLSVYELNKPNSYLENDTLTLRCRMWKNKIELSESVKYYTHTNLKVSKINCVWTLDGIIDCKNDNKINVTEFNEIKKIQKSFSEIPCFNIKLFYENTYAEDTIHVAIEQPTNIKQCFFISMIHLLDTDGRVAHSVQAEYLFRESANPQIWTFPFISKHKLLSNEKLYLPGCKITLQCEFSVSTGAVNNDIVMIEYGRIDDLQIPDPETSIQTRVPETSMQTRVPELSELWKENMQRFYQEGKFSDVTVSTPNRQFPVHKAILCAQSEVFSSMFEFEREMKEKHTGVVEIKDLENDTVSKMLMFLYTDTLEDLDFSMAYKLYFAADNYRIKVLHKKCSNYLIHCLDNSNVCDVVALADAHHDDELKSVAQDFISVHDSEIINSADWKKLMEDKPRLIAETMQSMFCKKFLSCPKP